MTTESPVNSVVWEKGLSRLRGELDPQIFSAYIKPLKVSSFDGSNHELEVEAPSMFVRNHVDRNFREKLVKALREETGSGINVRFSVAPTTSAATSHIVVKKIPAASRTVTLTDGRPSSSTQDSLYQHGLTPRYSFSSFVVGNNNQFCHAAAMRVAENPGKEYNPLFIFGGVGVGKTHLLHAIGNAILARKPSAKVLYMSSESFTNQVVQAIRNYRMEEFKNHIRDAEVLLIDDIQFMCSKERTQEEFFHTFNALYSKKHQMVITCDRMPKDIPQIEERLKTRFSWGLTADMQMPDFETRVAILLKKAASDGFELPVDVAQLVAEHINTSVREMEGALTRLHAVSSLQKKAVTLELAQAALRPLLQPKTVSISIDDIKHAVSDQFGVKISEMTSKRRTRNLCFPRHIAMYLCRKHTSASYPEIGASFGGRDHSSVIHASEVVAQKLISDHTLKETLAQIERRLLSA